MVDGSGGRKSPLQSKTVHFNMISAVFVPAIWPFLPSDFRNHDYAISAVTAWFALINILLRSLTKEALSWRKNKSSIE